MFELQVFVPVADNDGVSFSDDEHQAFEAFVVDRFGGLTLYPSMTVGVWIDPDARITYRDRSRVYAIAVASILDGAKIGEVVAFAKSHYRQLAIYVRFLGVAEIL